MIKRTKFLAELYTQKNLEFIYINCKELDVKLFVAIETAD